MAARSGSHLDESKPELSLVLPTRFHLPIHLEAKSAADLGIEVNHAPVTEVRRNDDSGLKVIEHAREHDIVYLACSIPRPAA